VGLAPPPSTLCAHSLQGYPSVGDAHSTITVPRDKWFEYGGERSGRFQVPLSFWHAAIVQATIQTLPVI
jgi:hypothetical protein